VSLKTVAQTSARTNL